MNAKERVVLPFVPVDMSRSAGKNGLYNHSFPFVCLKLTGFWHKLLRSRSRWKPVNSRSLQPGFCGHTRFRWLSRPVFSVQNRSRLFSRPVPFCPVPINRWWKPVQCWKLHSSKEDIKQSSASDWKVKFVVTSRPPKYTKSKEWSHLNF